MSLTSTTSGRTGISHHESTLQELKEQRSAVLSELARVTYPVLTLPPEITTEIFKWCIDQGKRLLPRVAPPTPALWDTISESDFSRHPRAEAVIEAWLSRAGTRLLSLGITSPKSAWLKPVLLRHAAQLKCIEVEANLNVLSDLAAIPSFPILTDLLFVTDGDDEGHITINGAPALRHLSLDLLLPSMVTVPGAQLTKLTLSLIPLSECLNALRWATSLQEFSREEGGEQSNSDESSVHHSSLVSLAISSRYDEDILPSGLEITTRSMKQDWIPTSSCFYRACPWFHPLTQLTTLELVHSVRLPFKTDVIRSLDRRTLPDFLLKLKSFVFSACPSNEVDDELLGALDSRCDASDAAHSKLESFSLIWPEFDYQPEAPAARIVLRLRALAGRGMRIHIGTRDENRFLCGRTQHVKFGMH